MKFSSNVEREAFLCIKEYLCSRDMLPGQKLKVKEIGRLVANLYWMV